MASSPIVSIAAISLCIFVSMYHRVHDIDVKSYGVCYQKVRLLHGRSASKGRRISVLTHRFRDRSYKIGNGGECSSLRCLTKICGI